MAGLLGFTLADLTGAVDSRKRQYGNLVRGLLSDPKALMEQLSAQDAEAAQRNRYTQASAGSVMPEVAQQGQQAMMDAVMNLGGLLGITAFHGSPHTFDKFDMSKIGTGEGAQAYGHGLYFAESPGVAKSYKDKLAKNEVLLDGQKVKHDRGLLDPQSMGLNALQLEPDPASAAAALRKAIADESLWQRGSQYDQRQNYAAAADWLEKNAARIKVDSGNLYKVDIPDDAVAKMLDWDKPLSQQPEAVRKALAPLQKMYRESDGVNGPYIAPDATGREVYGELRKMYGESKASAVFNGLGIPGIRYLDAGSRGKGGTSNFVLFDDNLPKILSRE